MKKKLLLPVLMLFLLASLSNANTKSLTDSYLSGAIVVSSDKLVYNSVPVESVTVLENSFADFTAANVKWWHGVSAQYSNGTKALFSAQFFIEKNVSYSLNDSRRSCVTNNLTNVSSCTLSWKWNNFTRLEWLALSNGSVSLLKGKTRLKTIFSPPPNSSGSFNYSITLFSGTVNYSFVRDPTWNTSFAYKQQIQTSCEVSTNLLNFPVAWNVSTASLITAGKMNANCSDAWVVNGSEAAALNFQVENTTCNTAATIIWSAQNLTCSANNSNYLYYGYPDAANGSTTKTWDPNYTTVVHFSNWSGRAGTAPPFPYAGYQGVFSDNGGYNASFIGANLVSCAVGVDKVCINSSGYYGQGIEFNGSLIGVGGYAPYLDFGYVAGNSSSFGIEAMLKLKNVSDPAYPNEQEIFSKYTTAAVDTFGFRLILNATGLTFVIVYDSVEYDLTEVYAPINWKIGVWYHAVIAFHNSTGPGTSYGELYLNGSLVANRTTTLSACCNGNDFIIGADAVNAQNPLNATIDEVRISDSPRSAQYFSAVWNKTVPYYGSEQALGGAAPPNTTVVGHNQTVAGETTSFYALWQTNTSSLGLWRFEFDNGTGTLVNDSWSTFPASNWSNTTKVINYTVGSTIRYRFWANDSSNNLNMTPVYSFTTMSSTTVFFNVTLTSPVNASSTNNATIQFTVTPMSSVYYAANITIYTNFSGSWQANETNSSLNATYAVDTDAVEYNYTYLGNPSFGSCTVSNIDKVFDTDSSTFFNSTCYNTAAGYYQENSSYFYLYNTSGYQNLTVVTQGRQSASCTPFYCGFCKLDIYNFTSSSWYTLWSDTFSSTPLTTIITFSNDFVNPAANESRFRLNTSLWRTGSATPVGAQNCYYYMIFANKTGGINNTQGLVSVPVGGLADGAYLWNGYACDTSGNCSFNTTTNYTFYLDRTAPNITIVKPTNNSVIYNNTNMTVNVSVSDAGSGALFCLVSAPGLSGENITVTNGWCNSTTISAGVTEGVSFISVWVWDTLGNILVNESQWIDYRHANNTINVSFSSPSNQSYTSNSTIQLKFVPKVSRYNIPNATVYANFSGSWAANETSTSITNGTTNTISVVVGSLADGLYIWNVRVCDSYDNCSFNTTTNYTFYLDRTGPVVNLTKPANDSIFTGFSNVTVNASSADAGFGASYCLIGVNGVDWLNVSVSLGWCNSTQLNISSEPDGRVNLWVQGFDGFNNQRNYSGIGSSYSALFSVRKDGTPPYSDNVSSNTSSPLVSQTIKHSSLWYDNFVGLSYCNFSSNYSGAWVNVSQNFSGVQNASWCNYSLTPTNTGIFWWIMYVNDSANNTNNTGFQTTLVQSNVEPYYLSVSTNGSTTTSSSLTHNVFWVAGGYNLNGSIFQTNYVYLFTDARSNGSWTAFSAANNAWVNTTATLPSAPGTYYWRVWANDSNNQWSLMLDEPVSVTTPPTPPGGGGGGGGGVIIVVPEVFSVAPGKLESNLTEGGVYSTQLKITNSHDSVITVSITSSSWILVQPISFSLNAGESKNVSVTASGTQIGLNTGLISFTATDGVTKTIQVPASLLVQRSQQAAAAQQQALTVNVFFLFFVLSFVFLVITWALGWVWRIASTILVVVCLFLWLFVK